MNTLGIIIGICILGIGVFVARNNGSTVSSINETQVEISPTLSVSDTPIPSETPSSTYTPVPPTKNPTQKPTNTPAPNNPSNATVSISRFRYPNATVTSSSDTRLELTSSDSPTSITDWYKNSINSIGMNTKSFVTTNTNGKVLNKLVGAGNGSEIRVEITKESSDSTVKIIVELK
jgi:hypothetical protein